MPDPGSGGGGQISHLILDDGKDHHQKDLCATCVVPIFCKCFCVVVWRGALEIHLAPNENLPSCHPPPTFPPLLLPTFPSSRSSPCQECKITFRAFSFLAISHITWRLWLCSCSGLLFCTSSLGLSDDEL